MRRSAIALTLAAMVGSLSFAQESTKRGPETREAERKEPRSAGPERREYNRNKFTVKDPDDFKTEGKQIFSGRQPGEKLPAFKATSLDGNEKGKELDPITSAGDKRQVLFFEDASRAAIVGLFNVTDAIGKIDRKADKDLQIACVFLCDDAELIPKGFAQLEHAQGFPELREQGVDVIAVSRDGRDGPGAYGLNRTVSQTIILAENGKVTRNFAFRQGRLDVDPHVMGGIAELIDEDRETVAGWLAEADEETARVRMRRDNDPRPAAKAAFREKLGEFMRAGKLTREEAGELHQAAFPERR